jgi:hypothetical protein
MIEAELPSRARMHNLSGIRDLGPRPLASQSRPGEARDQNFCRAPVADQSPRRLADLTKSEHEVTRNRNEAHVLPTEPASQLSCVCHPVFRPVRWASPSMVPHGA